MSRYDYESQVKGFETIFSEAQERGEKRGKRMAREALKTQLVGGLIGKGLEGITSLINERADALHFSQAPQRARYEQMLNDRQRIQTTLKPYIEQGGNKEDYLTNYYYDLYKTEAAAAKPNANVASYDSWLRSEANKKAKSMIPVFDKMQQESIDVPSFEEFQEQYSKYANQVTPRTISGAATKFVKNLFAKETDETLAYKNEKAKDILYGTSLFKESKELRDAIQEWNAEGNGVVDVINALNEKAKNGELVFKDLVDPKVIEWEEDSFGSTITKKGVLYISQDATGARVEKVKDLDIDSYKEKELTQFTEADKKSAYNAAQSVVSAFDKKDPRVKIFNDVVKSETLGLTFGSQILEVTKTLGKNPKDVTAQQIATNFLLNQAVKKGSLVGLRTTMTNWDVAKLSPPEAEKETEYLKNNILPNIKFFKEDIQSKLGPNHPEVPELYNDTLTFIKADSMNLTIDERQEYIKDLNKEFGYETSRNLITIQNNTETEDEEKTVLPLSKTQIGSKYNINIDTLNKFIEVKPKIGGVTQQAPGRTDPIDLVTNDMLVNAGYITEDENKFSNINSFKKIYARRKFINDLYKDLNI